jgi:hypothetical protein
MNDRPVESAVAEFLSGALAVGDALRVLQENVTIAVLRRPTLGLAVKGTGIRERHFPRDLRPAFRIAMTMSQGEIRRLVMLQDPRVWPLYGKRIVEWNEGQARAAAGQIAHSVGRIADHALTNAVEEEHAGLPDGRADDVGAPRRADDGVGDLRIAPDDSSGSAAAAKMAAPRYETPEQQSIFLKTLAAIQNIIGDREEITSRVIVDELARIEGGPWAQWGQGKNKKPITQRALARLLRPHEIFPVDVGPEHARRKGYRRAQFEGRPV